jgi:hypothetical protein
MKRIWIFLCFFSSYCSSAALPLVIDRHFSPYASSQDFFAIENQLIRIDNHYAGNLFDKKVSKEIETRNFAALLRPTLTNRILGRTFRFTELSLLWNPLNQLMITVQHEVFGHGYRLRDLGSRVADNLQYRINLPYPYGTGGGYTSYYVRPEMSIQDDILISLAGTEASALLAHQLSLSWLSKNEIDGREAPLHLFGTLDLYNYILSLKDSKSTFTIYSKNEGHDIANYMMRLNSIYPSKKSFKDQLEQLQLKASYSILANVFSYLALFAEYKYIWSGVSTPITKREGNIRFMMPIYRLGLTPFGSEDIAGLYLLLKSGEPSYFYYKEGHFSKNTYRGIGFENSGILRFNSSQIGFKFDLWSQPTFLFDTPKSHEIPCCLKVTEDFWWLTKETLSNSKYDIEFDHSRNAYTEEELFNSHIGAAASLIYQYSFKGKFSNIAYTQLGYKTKGYLPGESIHAGLILRFGMNLLF